MLIRPLQLTCWSSIPKYRFQWSARRAPRPHVPLQQHVTNSHLQNRTISSYNTNTMFLERLHLITSSHIQPFNCTKSQFLKTMCSSASNRMLPNLNELSLEDKINLVKYELEILREGGETDLPSVVKDVHWQKLTTIASVSGRKKFFRFLFLNEMKALHDKEKKEAKHLFAKEYHDKVNKELLSSGEDHISYGLWRNCFMLKITDQRMNNGYHQRLVSARLHGQPIVFDDDFDASMTSREKSELGKQLALCMGMNRTHLDPYYIHICNFDHQHETAQSIQKSVPTLNSIGYPVDTHNTSYTEIFPRDKLVYLSPDAKEEMSSYDHDAVYIIGNIVDRGAILPLSLAKAKKEGIRMQKFPLDTYLDWGLGNKCLTLNQVLGIMLEMKHTGSWVKAFEKNVPKRKLVKPQQEDGPSIKRKMMMRRKPSLHSE